MHEAERTAVARRLNGKVALVTGAASGIGQATARRMATEGAIVVVADLRLADAEATAKAIRDDGGDAEAMGLDVTRVEVVDSVVERVVSRHGSLDVLMNAAGTLAFGSVGATSDETWASVLGVNLTGTFNVCRAAIRAMRDAAGGAIINVSSTTGAFGVGSELAAYVASKGGIVMLTKAIAVDHAKDGVRANAIAPGPTATTMLRKVMSQSEMTAFGDSLPVRRLGEPGEIAQLAAFLASDEASFLTGALIAADGGQTSQVGPTPKDL
jgi:NAD(P)-dependent dehydrogenase (short-subunit alcohol dehydrogenase family)